MQALFGRGMPAIADLAFFHLDSAPLPPRPHKACLAKRFPGPLVADAYASITAFIPKTAILPGAYQNQGQRIGAGIGLAQRQGG